MLRVHLRTNEALHFGRAGLHRWDDPLRKFGVLYSGADRFVAFIETFGQTTGARLLDEMELETRALSSISIKKPLKLVDLTGPGLARLGADNRICDGEFAVSQRWSRALFEHPSRPDGLLYRARHDPSRLGIALFDRARFKLGRALRIVDSFASPAHETALAELLDQYGFGLA